jgi:L-fucose isomerase-like protein
MLGIELIDIPIQELLDEIGDTKQIYEALKVLINRYQLQGFTLRCFDLLTTVKDTGCMALAKLNSEGYVAGCEGDVPAMLSMMIVRSLLDISGFQANPSRINPETGEMLFAHCTIPLDMVEHYELDTHFESGIGTGIRGYMKEGPVTIFKVAGNLSRSFIAEGELVRNEAKPDLCRTQQVIRLSDKSLTTSYFHTNPIGNHHIIMPGHCKQLLEHLLK